MFSTLKQKIKAKRLVIIIPFICLFFAVTCTYAVNAFFESRIFPNVYVNNLNLGFLRLPEAQDKIEKSTKHPDTITLFYEDRYFDVNLKELNLKYDAKATVEAAHTIYKNQSRIGRLKSAFTSLFRKNNVELVYTIDKKLLNELLLVTADELTTMPVSPSIKQVSGEFVVNRGQSGTSIDVNKLQDVILEKLRKLDFDAVAIKVDVTDNVLTQSQVDVYKIQAEQIFPKKITFTYEDTKKSVTGNEILEFLNPRGGVNAESISSFISKLKNEVEREAQNSVFVFENERVKEFAPSKDGVKIDTGEFTKLTQDAIAKLETTDTNESEITIPVVLTKPNITTEEVNNLGIRELIGKGTSKFAGSIPSRIHNVGVASNKFNGVLIPPGETLSFNKILGDVSAFTGYKQAYIIKDGKTVLGDGGGVCQVSTTLFRAVLNAGLPIVERRSHSYRVTYYEQDAGPGLDATVYDPTTDFKFTNNTDNYILIQTIYDTSRATLAFELYGTSDGRVATITKPIVTSSSPPPEDLYQDDPTLPAGEIKQIDWAAWGAKVKLDYHVERNGEVLENTTFYSNYKPWQAKYLRGTGPAI